MERVFALFESISSIISNLDSNGMLNFAGLILSTVVPIVIMVFTLRREKKAAKHAAIEQEKQYNESKKLAEKQHKEQLETQNEINRVAIMPYLIIENILAKAEIGRVKFSISFKNIGNGTAINLRTKYIEHNSSLLCPIHETKLATYCCTYPFDVYLPIARQDEVCQLEISQELNDSSIDNIDCFALTLEYTDMKSQYYEQTFSINFDAHDLSNIEFGRLITNNPELKKHSQI